MLVSFAQGEANIWYFGNNAGLDFNNGSPLPLTNGQLNTSEGCATLCDATGQLLFYTDGVTVWNRNHAIMLNGNGLMGHDSTSQSATIVQLPGSSSLYYIFTLDYEVHPNGFRYSIVDLSLDGGLGGVTSNKNVLIYTPSDEKLSIVKHANNIDYWVVTHGWNNNSFYSYLLTSAGLSSSPVTSNIGTVVTGLHENVWGCMKISPDGSKLAISHMLINLELMDFNNSTGVISNPQILFNNLYSYGVEFSSDSQLLYVSVMYSSPAKIIQYNLNSNNILGTAQIFNTPSIIPTALQLGPDEKIYVGERDKSKLSVINSPNIIGVGCDLQLDAIDLGGRISQLGLPPFVSSFFAPSFTVEDFCLGAPTQFNVTSSVPVTNVSWDFGDGSPLSTIVNPTHQYGTTGNYTVTMIATSANGTISKSKTIVIASMPVANQPSNLYTCTDASNNGRELFDLSQQTSTILGSQSTSNFTVSYHSSPSDASTGTNELGLNFTNTSNPQTIFVRVENNVSSSCFATTSFQLQVNAIPVLVMDDSYTICQGHPITINAPLGFSTYNWSNGGITSSNSITVAGSYSLTVTKDYGTISCATTKDFVVYNSNIATITTIETQDWTDNQNMINVQVTGDGDYEYSIDGINYQDTNIFEGLTSGQYTVFVNDKKGCGTITESVFLLIYPKFFTPNGDGINDMWHIKFSNKEPAMELLIFDRYGKIIAGFKGLDFGWDGTLNGKLLFADDYWFVVKRQNGKEFKGHFSLLR